jgi:hypothetical protein
MRILRDPMEELTTPTAAPAVDADTEIRAVVERLARPHPSGGVVIERAAVMAEGAGSAAILRWISAHAGEAEELAVKAPSGGLHGSRLRESGGADAPKPSRYVLPAGVCAER